MQFSLDNQLCLLYLSPLQDKDQKIKIKNRTRGKKREEKKICDVDPITHIKETINQAAGFTKADFRRGRPRRCNQGAERGRTGDKWMFTPAMGSVRRSASPG